MLLLLDPGYPSLLCQGGRSSAIPVCLWVSGIPPSFYTLSANMCSKKAPRCKSKSKSCET